MAEATTGTETTGNSMSIHTINGKPVKISLIIQDIDTNPKIQNKVHTIGFWYWTVNFPVITYLFFYQPALWLKYGLFITLIYSIYANWTSDYTGMSASQSLVIPPADSTEVATITPVEETPA